MRGTGIWNRSPRIHSFLCICVAEISKRQMDHAFRLPFVVVHRTGNAKIIYILFRRAVMETCNMLYFSDKVFENLIFLPVIINDIEVTALFDTGVLTVLR